MIMMKKPRIYMLDNIRGFALINMMAYHALWDIVYLFGVNMPWYRGMGAFIWQQLICCTFIALSGFCLPLGRNGVKRGAIVFGCGWVISLVMKLFSPSTPNWFGVLTLTGAAMVIISLIRPFIDRLPKEMGLVLSIMLFLATRFAKDGYLGLGSVTFPLPDFLYSGWISAWLGFPFGGFHSTDYFPIIPWIFLFAAGYFLHGIIGTRVPEGRKLPILTWLGRHSLEVYMVHQPLIMGVLTILFKVI